MDKAEQAAWAKGWITGALAMGLLLTSSEGWEGLRDEYLKVLREQKKGAQQDG